MIDYVFDRFDYYEPAGMEIVTLFQCHHSKSINGWFTRDTSRKCAEELENLNDLCFAYQLPFFYLAEGGWGHHMPALGNHPIIANPVQMKLRFEDFDNTVMINGNYRFSDIIKYLKQTENIPEGDRTIRIILFGVSFPCDLLETNARIGLRLSEFMKAIEEYIDKMFPKHAANIDCLFEIK